MKVWKMMFPCIKVMFRFCVNFPASSKWWMHQFWRGAPLNLKPASVGLPDVKGDRSLSYGKKYMCGPPKASKHLVSRYLDPKNKPKKHKNSGGSWKTRVISPYPWTPSAHEKWRVLHPQNMGELTPKNEGFMWVPMVRFIKPPGRMGQSCNSDDDDSHLLQLLGGGQHRRPRLCAPFGGPGAQGGSNKVGPGSSCTWSYQRPL